MSLSASPYSDCAAIRLAAQETASLATIVHIEGSYSRRLGAQLSQSGTTMAGSLADGCLEQEIVKRMADMTGGEPNCLRYGAGSPFIDFRLPCGAGLDILLDPRPDHEALRHVVSELDARRPASLSLPVAGDTLLSERAFIPPLRIILFGDGPEVSSLTALGSTYGAIVEQAMRTEPLSIGQRPNGITVDPWTALILFFHDHEWETALLQWALESDAFYIGAQGGARTREVRNQTLAQNGWSDAQISRVRSPVGLIDHARDPETLALSVLAEITRDYEALHPHK